MSINNQAIFEQNSIEFVTVAAEFCNFMEQTGNYNRREYVDTALKLLPLLYLKASLIPECELIGLEDPEHIVTEDDYEYIRYSVKRVMGGNDDYLEVFLPDMVYSEGPLTRTISEDMADIYQSIKDFIGVFRMGLDITMNDSLVLCKEHFEEYWGQILVNCMRALHDVKYNQHDEDAEEQKK